MLTGALWCFVRLTMAWLGFTVVPFGQGFKDMSPPTKELMKLTLEEKIAHGGHPALRWMMDNKRKTANGKFYWNCSTYLQEGKAACPAKQIPEDTLYAVSAEALGIPAFDADIFAERVAEIQVPDNNRLLFIFRDGSKVEKVWQDRSRRDSWDDAMRQAARERQIEIVKRRNRE